MIFYLKQPYYLQEVASKDGCGDGFTVFFTRRTIGFPVEIHRAVRWGNKHKKPQVI